MDYSTLGMGQHREILKNTAEQLSLAEQKVDEERNEVLKRVFRTLSLLLPVCYLPLREVGDILGFDVEVDRRRRSTILRVVDALSERFPDFNFVSNDLNKRICYEKVNEVFVPPDSQEMHLSGEGIYVPPRNFPKDKLIEETLLEMGINTKLCDGKEGENDPNMFRGQSYQQIIIPELNKMILFCNEEGYRTFVIHTIGDPEEFYRMRISELRVHRDVENFIWNPCHDEWKQRLREALERDGYVNPYVSEDPMEEKIFVLGGDEEKIYQGGDLPEDGVIFVDCVETDEDGEKKIRRRRIAPAKIFGESRNTQSPRNFVTKMKRFADPVPGVHVSISNWKVPFYWLDDLERWIPRRIDESGVGEINGKRVYSRAAYKRECNELGITFDKTTLKELIEHYEIKSASYNFLRGPASVGMYYEEDLDFIVPVTFPNGVKCVGGRLYCSRPVLAKVLGFSPQFTIKLLNDVDLKPHPVLGGGSNEYSLEEMMEHIPDVIDVDVEQGEIDGRVYAVVEKIAETEECLFSYVLLRSIIFDNELEIVSGIMARNGKVIRGKVDPLVVWKDDLDKVMPLRIDQKTGVVDIDGIEYVGFGYSRICRHETLFRKGLEEGRFGKYTGDRVVRSGTQNRIIDVFLKEDVDRCLGL